MGRKRRSDELEFGSDSFLDIVANMVGIVIILIVIVGLRVQRIPPEQLLKSPPPAAAPPSSEEQKAAYEKTLAAREAENQRIRMQNEQEKQEREKALALQREELARRAAKKAAAEKEKEEFDEQLAQRKSENEKREKLLAGYAREAAELDAQTAQLFALAKSEEEKRKKDQAQADEAKRKLQEKAQEKSRLEAVVAHEQDVLNRRKATWESLGKQLVELRDQISQLQNKPLEVKQWVHYATPISKQIEQKQIHFRCLSGRVANIYLFELLDRARDRLSSVGPGPGVLGVVGPIGGFRLNFTAQRTGQTLSDQLYNPFSYRISITSWEIGTDVPNIGETVEEAVEVGSKFRESLETSPPGVYAVTLWVYPESFTMARTLRDFLHKRGYDVALRPLPVGIPIAGSPFGSASRAQ